MAQFLAVVAGDFVSGWAGFWIAGQQPAFASTHWKLPLSKEGGAHGANPRPLALLCEKWSDSAGRIGDCACGNVPCELFAQAFGEFPQHALVELDPMGKIFQRKIFIWRVGVAVR